MKYLIVWDNGASACGTFSYKFESYAAAQQYAEDWANESNIRDFGTTEPESGYSYDIVCEVEDNDLNDLDVCEGVEHYRMTQYARIT